MNEQNQHLIMKEGYTLRVTSWENDGDNYRTIDKLFSTEVEARAVQDMAKVVFQSCNNGDGGIGNSFSDYQDANVIVNYLIKNPKLLELNNLTQPTELKRKIQEMFDEAEDDWEHYILFYIEEVPAISREWSELIMEYNYDILGGSEDYNSRVYESSIILYCQEDLYVQELA